MLKNVTDVSENNMCGENSTTLLHFSVAVSMSVVATDYHIRVHQFGKS
jgi:hypothetical protein